MQIPSRILIFLFTKKSVHPILLIVNNSFQLQNGLLDWFPRMQAMSLAAQDDAVENNDMRSLIGQLEGTASLVKSLSRQLQVGFRSNLLFIRHRL